LGGLPVVPANASAMPDMDSLLVRSFIGALSAPAASCTACRRTPLAGEIVHRLDGGSLVCELCFAALPANRRLAVSSERVHASERRLSVAPKAA
jgi:hypothetical protein